VTSVRCRWCDIDGRNRKHMMSLACQAQPRPLPCHCRHPRLAMIVSPRANDCGCVANMAKASDVAHRRSLKHTAVAGVEGGSKRDVHKNEHAVVCGHGFSAVDVWCVRPRVNFQHACVCCCCVGADMGGTGVRWVCAEGSGRRQACVSNTKQRKKINQLSMQTPHQYMLAPSLGCFKSYM
jgi:hypothetical protein